MQTVQRQFGKFMKRSANDSQVAILLEDFDKADRLLGRIIDSTKAWRDGWSSLLTFQGRMLVEFEGLYAPIVVSSEASTFHQPVSTPETTQARTSKLRGEYEDLRKELLDELASVDERMIAPAMQARDCLLPVKKTIKKREDRKLDYERYQSRVDNYSKKAKRLDRDNTALSKAEIDLARATEAQQEYHRADEHLRQCLPPLITAVFSMLPCLLASQVEIQNTLLAHYYTVIYNYCEETEFSSTPPEMDQAVSQFEQVHQPIQKEIERFACLVNGKTVLLSSPPMTDRQNSHTSLNGRLTNGLGSHRPRPASSRKNSSNGGTSPPSSIQGRLGAPSPSTPTLSYDTKPRLSDQPASSASSTLSAPSTYPTSQTSNSSINENHLASPAISAGLSTVAERTKMDYFNRNHQCNSEAGLSPRTPSDYGAIAVGKKKPPPPPPKPRASCGHLAVFVTALYDFGGQSTGDLAFREGDRIRVLKRTDSTDDWWEGELRGVKGSFPANYVE